MWLRIINSGVQYVKTEEERIYVRNTNLISLFLAAISLPYYFMISKWWPLGAQITVFIFFYLLLPLLNNYGMIHLTRFLLSIAPSVNINLGAAWFPYPNETFPFPGRILAFGMILIPLLLFSYKELRKILFVIVLNFAIYLSWYWLNPLLNVEGLDILLPIFWLDIALSTTVLGYLLYGAYQLIKQLNEARKMLEEATMHLWQQTEQLQKEKEKAQQQAEELEKAYKDLSASQAALKAKSEALEAVKKRLEASQRQLLLERQRERQLHQLEQFMRQQLNRTTKHFCHQVLNYLGTRFDGATIVLYLKRGEVLEPLATYGLLNEEKALQSSFVESFFKHQKPYFYVFRGKSHWEVRTGLARVPVAAFALFPLTYQDEPFAVMEWTFLNVPEKEHLETLQMMLQSFANLLFYKLHIERSHAV